MLWTAVSEYSNYSFNEFHEENNEKYCLSTGKWNIVINNSKTSRMSDSLNFPLFLKTNIFFVIRMIYSILSFLLCFLFLDDLPLRICHFRSINLTRL